MINGGSRSALACVSAGLIAVALTANSPQRQGLDAAAISPGAGVVTIAISAGPGLRLLRDGQLPDATAKETRTLYCRRVFSSPIGAIGYRCAHGQLKTAARLPAR